MSTEHEPGPRQTPLLDLLRLVPSDARMIYAHSPIHSQNIPVGALAADAAAEIARLDALVKEQAQEIERLRAQRVPLTEEQLMKCLAEASCYDKVKMTFDSGPYSIGCPTVNARNLCRAIEAAHGIHPLQRLADLSKEIGEKL